MKVPSGTGGTGQTDAALRCLRAFLGGDAVRADGDTLAAFGNDMTENQREVLEAADGGSSRAQLAYERFVLSIRRALGAMAGVLGGVDAVVFTGGIGENSARVRRDATRALRFAGLELPEDADAPSNADRDVAAPASRVRVLVVRAREDLAILKEVLRLRGRVDEKVEESS